MPRAHRHFIPGLIWHITQRCHRQAFLLKFVRDRDRWRHWLREARERYGLCVFDFIVTSNHIHLLVRDRGKGEIPAAMQLLSGRLAQEYNDRKSRKGAFWEDRYHATAVESGEHLARCLVYIDLNMVRAGAVEHPGQWSHCGYREIQEPPRYKQVLDSAALATALGLANVAELPCRHGEWVEGALHSEPRRRDDRWTASVAVGSAGYIARVHKELGVRIPGRRIEAREDQVTLRDEPGRYGLDNGEIDPK